MPNICWFQLLKCQALLLFSVLCCYKFSSSGFLFGLFVGQNMQFEEMTSGSWKMRLTLVTTFFLMFYSNNKQTNNETVSCGFTLQKSANHFHFFFLFNLHCLGSLEDCVYCKLRCVIIAENPTQLIDLLFTKMCVTRKRWALMIQSNYSIST